MSQNETSWRYSFVGAIFAILPLLIVLQVFRIQIDPRQSEKIMIESQGWSSFKKTIVPARGLLYDRLGNLLAGNRTVYEVGVELQFVENPQTIAQTVATILDVDYADAYTRASLEPSDTAVYAVLADNVPQEAIDKLSILVEQMSDAYSGGKGENLPSLRGLVFTPHSGPDLPGENPGLEHPWIDRRRDRDRRVCREHLLDQLRVDVVPARMIRSLARPVSQT